MWLKGAGLLSGAGHYDYFEMFAGVGLLSAALRSFGFHGKSYDVIYDKDQDILTPQGLMAAVTVSYFLSPYSLAFIAVPCSSWIFMSMGSTHRSQTNPRGNRNFAKVRNQNREHPNHNREHRNHNQMATCVVQA